MVLGKFFLEQRGSAVVLTALALSLFIGFSAVVVDVGMLYVNKAQQTTMADAAALAGALDLPDQPQAARAIAEGYAVRNGKPGDTVTVTVAEDRGSLSVRTTRVIELLFARFFEVFTSSVSASAKAAIKPLSATTGIVPLGVVKQDFVFGQTYVLKEGAGDGYEGNYGALALGGTGASNYQDNLRLGYKGKIKIGDWLTTETGNMSGPTRQGVNWRLDQDPTASYTNVAKNSARIVMIPVIDSLPGNGRGEVLVVGFAAFFLESVGGGGGNLVTGRFLRMAVAGETTEGAGYGLYGVRLVE